MEIEQVEQITKESKRNCLKSRAFTTIWPISLIVYALAWTGIKVFYIESDSFRGESLPCFVLILSDFGYFVYVIVLVVVHVIMICINHCCHAKEKDRTNFLKKWMIAEAVLLGFNIVFTTAISVGTDFHKNGNCPKYVTASFAFVIINWILCFIQLVLIILACLSS